MSFTSQQMVPILSSTRSLRHRNPKESRPIQAKGHRKTQFPKTRTSTKHVLFLRRPFIRPRKRRIYIPPYRMRMVPSKSRPPTKNTSVSGELHEKNVLDSSISNSKKNVKASDVPFFSKYSNANHRIRIKKLHI